MHISSYIIIYILHYITSGVVYMYIYIYIDIDRYRYDTMCIYIYNHLYIYIYMYIYICVALLGKSDWIPSLSGGQQLRFQLRLGNATRRGYRSQGMLGMVIPPSVAIPFHIDILSLVVTL